MELNWLEDCIALAETLNFSRAAESRHVTQPAFSRRIQALEEWVGTPLFLRTRQSVKLTPAGEAFHRRALGLVSSIHAARSEALEMAGLHSPAVVFLATHVLSFTVFPSLVRSSDDIAQMRALQLVSETLRACEKLMLQGRAQFLLCHQHRRMRMLLDPARHARIVVGHDVLQPFSAPDETGGVPRWRLDGRGEVPLLAYSRDSGLGRIVAGHPPFQRLERRLTTMFTSDLAATLLAMCRAGQGVAWLPATLVEDDLRRGTLVAAAPGTVDMDIPMQICVLRSREPLSADAERLWQALTVVAADVPVDDG